MSTAVVFGATGQVGSYLVPYLLERGLNVVGALRRTSTLSTGRLQGVLQNPRFRLAYCDVTDPWAVSGLLASIRPQYVYNLAAQSYVKTSFEEPQHTTTATYLGVVNILEALRSLRDAGHDVRLYQASSSEMYGSAWSKMEKGSARADVWHRPPTVEEAAPGPGQAFQDELTPMLPNSPYAVAKLAAHNMVRIYRASYGLHACCGIIFNTESEVRGEEFVTRKVTRYVGRLRVALDHGRVLPNLSLGNVSAHRDWSHCSDTVRAMVAILERDGPADDYVIGTGRAHSVLDFVREAFKAGGIADWREFVTVGSEQHFRPCEVPFLRGLAAKAHHLLGFSPRVGFEDLVFAMVGSDIELARKEALSSREAS